MKLTKSTLAILALALISFPAVSKPAKPLVRKVMVAGNGDLDTCMSTSSVKQLKPGSFLSVRAGPSVKAKEIARLRPGDAVWNCDDAGAWVGVVFNSRQRTQDEGIECDLGPSNTARRPFRGDCQAGWVHGSYLISLAG